MQWILSKKMKFSKNQKGLTLVELLAVIVILGVIAAIAVPAIGGIINSSKTNADKATVDLLKQTAERYMMDLDPDGDLKDTNGAPLLGVTGPNTAAVLTVSQMNTANYLKSIPNKQSAATATPYANVTLGYTAGAGWVAAAVV